MRMHMTDLLDQGGAHAVSGEGIDDSLGWIRHPCISNLFGECPMRRM
jgi:hypothetical protein